MSTDTTHNQDTGEPISKRPSPTDRIYRSHIVIGTDVEGRIHHYVKDYNREFITEEGGAVYVIADDELSDAYYLGTHSLTEWVEQVEQVSGWYKCHVITGIVEAISGDTRDS
ncbi:hypothetical protein [Halovivax limisalsi]|uniref:hypothetical protein n=1 Tax=Halovivax limisalsi TaxID=1453760 RepID=UPI001FFDB52A|nr:hypothetical protein [Halovivax limisalsi]